MLLKYSQILDLMSGSNSLLFAAKKTIAGKSQLCLLYSLVGKWQKENNES